MSKYVHRVIEKYDDNMLGLPYPVTILRSAEECVDASGNIVGRGYPDVEGLCRELALQLCHIPTYLTGKEVKFIRCVARLSRCDFATQLGMSESKLIWWEEGSEQLEDVLVDSRVKAITVRALSKKAEDVVHLYSLVPSILPAPTNVVITRANYTVPIVVAIYKTSWNDNKYWTIDLRLYKHQWYRQQDNSN